MGGCEVSLERERFELAQWSRSNLTALFYFCLFSLARPTGFSHRAATIHTVLPPLYVCVCVCVRVRVCVCVHVCSRLWPVLEKMWLPLKLPGEKGTEKKMEKEEFSKRKKERQKKLQLNFCLPHFSLCSHYRLAAAELEMFTTIIHWWTLRIFY